MNGLSDAQLTEILDEKLIKEFANSSPIYELADEMNAEFRDFFYIISDIDNNEGYIKYREDAHNNIPVY